jgi:hypothetical protein
MAKGSFERRKTFINTRLAETWEIRGKGADLHELEKRKENIDFAEMVPAGVLFLTAGVDVQDDRLEARAGAGGWMRSAGLSTTRYSAATRPCRRRLPGRTERSVRNEASPWARLLRTICVRRWTTSSA